MSGQSLWKIHSYIPTITIRLLDCFRLSLPEDWRGIRDQELTEKSGIPGSIFVHASGFIGGNKTYAGALQMARRALKRRKQEDGDTEG